MLGAICDIELPKNGDLWQKVLPSIHTSMIFIPFLVPKRRSLLRLGRDAQAVHKCRHDRHDSEDAGARSSETTLLQRTSAEQYNEENGKSIYRFVSA